VRAWVVDQPGPIDGGPLRLVERPSPVPAGDEVVVEVSACGVCRTDLHLAEGDLPPRRPGVTPGHQVVGTVVERGPAALRFSVGDRIGVAWLRRTCGVCRFCVGGRENLCLRPSFTGWDADGGFAARCTVPEAFAYRLPGELDDASAAPLLCAGIIGYRALLVADCPDGGALGVWGFGASAHLTAQSAMARGIRVHVFTRAAAARQLALELGCASAQDSPDASPEPLQSAIVFAPVGTVVPLALRQLDRGGICAVAGVHLSDVPRLVYEEELFYEKQLRSVTANTRADGIELLAMARTASIRPRLAEYDFPDLPRALSDIAADRLVGSAVVRVA
jgi:propanol-preferring alcohol dehydrogenase